MIASSVFYSAVKNLSLAINKYAVLLLGGSLLLFIYFKYFTTTILKPFFLRMQLNVA